MVRSSLEYCYSKDYEENNYKIITLKELKAMNKDLTNLEVDDIITNGDYYRKVMHVIGGKYNLYMCSNYYNNLETVNKCLGIDTIYSSEELKKLSYKLCQPKDDKIKEAIKFLEGHGVIKAGKIINQ